MLNAVAGARAAQVSAPVAGARAAQVAASRCAQWTVVRHARSAATLQGLTRYLLSVLRVERR